MPVVKTTEAEAVLNGLQRKKTNKAVLLYSGGADSTVAGLMLQEQGYEIYPLFFDYGQNALDAETYQATRAAAALGFHEPKVIKTDIMQMLSQSALLSGNALDDTNAWVPGRNTLFMIVAGIYAHQINADGLAVGYMLDDQGVFGDSNIVHHKMMELLLGQTLSRPMDVILPLSSMTKRQVLEFLKERDALDLTVSCWNAKVDYRQVITCHQCANCLEREQTLAQL